MSRRALLHSGAVLGAGAACAAMPSGAASAMGSRNWPSVDKLVRSYVDSRRLANLVIMLGWGQQEPDVVAAGRDSFLADRIADPDSIFRIYSMTKPITGMAAMMLMDEGKLALDQPLSDVLPAFANMQAQIEYDGAITPDNLEPAIRPITMRHLLTHTSGLGYGIVQQGPVAELMRNTGAVSGVVSRLEGPGLFRGVPAASLAAFADALAKVPLIAQPGTRWSYSLGLDLMGRVIEVVSGQPFDAFLQQRILDPCGMSSTWFQVPQNEKFRFTANYLRVNDHMLPVDIPGTSVYLDDPAYPYGGSGLVSTPRDYDRFLRMLAGFGEIDGTRVLSEAAVRMGTSDLLPDTLPRTGEYGGTWGYGAGGRVGRGERLGEYGWAGSAGTFAAVNLRTGLRVGLFTQYMPSDIYNIRDEFTEAVFRDAAKQGKIAG